MFESCGISPASFTTSSMISLSERSLSAQSGAIPSVLQAAIFPQLLLCISERRKIAGPDSVVMLVSPSFGGMTRTGAGRNEPLTRIGSTSRMEKRVRLDEGASA
jgi:hypothetical protein